MRKLWLQVGIGVALLALLLGRARVWDLSEELGNFSAWAALYVLLLNLPAIGLLAVRTHFVLRRLGYRVSPLSLAPVSALGNVAAVVTPGATGDIIRAPFLKGRHAVAYSDSFATIVYERTYSFCILCLSTLLVVAWDLGPHPLRIAIPVVGLLVLAVPALAAMPLLSLCAWAGKTQSTRLWQRPLLHALNLGEGRWAQSLATLARDLRLSVIFVVLTIAIFAMMVLQVWIISTEVAVRLSAGEACIALGASVAAGIASFLPLGLGVLDWTMTAVIQQAGATAASATSVAILYRATNSLPAGLLGVLGYAYLVIRLRRVETGPSPESAAAGATDTT